VWPDWATVLLAASSPTVVVAVVVVVVVVEVAAVVYPDARIVAIAVALAVASHYIYI
jgi:hypothetical protein